MSRPIVPRYRPESQWILDALRLDLQSAVRRSHQPAREARPPRLGLYQVLVKTIDDNVLTCVYYDGTTEGQTIYVAMPHELRRAAWEGQTVSGVTYTYSSSQTRSATDGVDTITEVITPLYVADYTRLIVARVDNLEDLTDGSSNVADFMDLNAGGRQWADNTV